MRHAYFEKLECAPDNTSFKLTEVINQLVFNERGLIPVITQDATSKSVLMLAWMNKNALQLTLSSKRMTYWSRSREELWVKGKTSGHTQALASMSFDCDGDAILCLVHQQGIACHTGRTDCFYLSVDVEQNRVYISTSVAGGK